MLRVMIIAALFLFAPTTLLYFAKLIDDIVIAVFIAALSFLSAFFLTILSFLTYAGSFVFCLLVSCAFVFVLFLFSCLFYACVARIWEALVSIGEI